MSASRLTPVSPPGEVEDGKHVSGDPALHVIHDPVRQARRRDAPRPQSGPAPRPRAAPAPRCLQERPSAAARTWQVTGDGTPPGASRKRPPTWTLHVRAGQPRPLDKAPRGLAREQASASPSPSRASERGHPEPAARAVAPGLPGHFSTCPHHAPCLQRIPHATRDPTGSTARGPRTWPASRAVSSVPKEPDTPFPRAGGRRSTLPKCW